MDAKRQEPRFGSFGRVWAKAIAGSRVDYHEVDLQEGSRYKYETGMRERNNNLLAGFDPGIANPIGQGIKKALRYAGINRAPTGCYSPPTKKFAPRIGVAQQWNIRPPP